MKLKHILFILVLLLIPTGFTKAALVSKNGMLSLTNQDAVTGFGENPVINLKLAACTKAKCVNPTYRIKLTKLNSKNKVVTNIYSAAKTLSEEITLKDLAYKTKYNIVLEKKNGKVWQEVAASKFSFTTGAEPVFASSPWTTSVPTKTATTSSQKGAVLGTTILNLSPADLNLIRKLAEQKPEVKKEELPYKPFEVNLEPLANPVLDRAQPNQILMKVRLFAPSNRPVTLTKFIIAAPTELKLLNVKLYLGQHQFGSTIHSQDGSLLNFDSNLSVPAGSPMDLVVTADLRSDVFAGTGAIGLAGISTTYSGNAYENIHSPAGDVISKFEIPAPYIAQPTTPAPVTPTNTFTAFDFGNGIVGGFYKQGTGATVVQGKRVAVHYIGTFDDGTKFDSSVDRGQPFIFTVGAGQVIQGWDLTLQGRKVGDIFKIRIPSHLAYGATGAGGIPANTPINFDISVIEVEQ